MRDDFIKVELANPTGIAAKNIGQMAMLTTRRGKIYYVWIDYEGMPLIQQDHPATVE